MQQWQHWGRLHVMICSDLIMCKYMVIYIVIISHMWVAKLVMVEEFITISILLKYYTSVSRTCKHLVMIGDDWFTKYAVENNVDTLSAGLHPTCVSRFFCNLLNSLGKVYTTILISMYVCVCVCVK